MLAYKKCTFFWENTFRLCCPCDSGLVGLAGQGGGYFLTHPQDVVGSISTYILDMVV